MPAPIDEAQVRHIAKLARLNLAPDEVATFARQLGAILEYVRELESLDVSQAEPLAHPLPLVNVLRPDEPRPSFDTETALSNAPDREREFFRVPAVLDQDGGA